MDREKNKRVLVVEDNPAARDSLITFLGMEGYAVEGVANGREAFDCLRHRPRPRVILLDLMMPVMDGWTFLRQRAQDPAAADIPVVVLTASGPEQKQAVRSLGADGFLEKPVEADDLLGVVERYC